MLSSRDFKEPISILETISFISLANPGASLDRQGKESKEGIKLRELLVIFYQVLNKLYLIIFNIQEQIHSSPSLKTRTGDFYSSETFQCFFHSSLAVKSFRSSSPIAYSNLCSLNSVLSQLFLTIFESSLLSHFQPLSEIFPFIILIYGVVFLPPLTHGETAPGSHFLISPKHWACSKAQPFSSGGGELFWVRYQYSSLSLSTQIENYPVKFIQGFDGFDVMVVFQVNFQLQHFLSKLVRDHKSSIILYALWIDQIDVIQNYSPSSELTGYSHCAYTPIIIMHSSYKMIEQTTKTLNSNHTHEFWCHNCQQQFTSHLRPGIDEVNCPRCSNDFCQIFTPKSKPNSYSPYQKPLRPKNRRLPRYSAQAVLVALSQYTEDASTEKVREINEEDIRRLKIKVDKNLEECLICKEDFRMGMEALKCPCGHVFHVDCLSEWMEYKNNCPKCRAPILTQFQYTV